MGEVNHRYIDTNGIKMHVAEQGEGPLVVFCHGFPELWYSWRHQLPALAKAGYHAVAPDQRGYGQTDRPEAIEAYILRRGLNETFPLSGDSGIRVSKSARRSYVCFAPHGGRRWLGVVSNSRKTSDESSMRNARAIPISWFATRC